MNLKERLLLFLDNKNLSQGKFEKETDVSNGFVNNIGDGITTTSLLKILNKFPDLNATWLLTGNGEMLINEKSGTEPAPDYLLTLKNKIDQIAFSLHELSTEIAPPVAPGTIVHPQASQTLRNEGKTSKKRKQADT